MQVGGQERVIGRLWKSMISRRVRWIHRPSMRTGVSNAMPHSAGLARSRRSACLVTPRPAFQIQAASAAHVKTTGHGGPKFKTTVVILKIREHELGACAWPRSDQSGRVQRSSTNLE